MQYTQLAELYEKLEITPAKLEKTALIADFLEKPSSVLLPKVVVLLIGRVFPAWSEKDLGVAGQTVIKAITRATGASEKEIVSKLTETGDLGLVAEWFVRKKKQRTLVSRNLDIDFVFRNLQKIADQAGKGSQDRKLNLVAELLIHSRPKEARYITRTVLEELRVGVAEGIVRDSIARAFNAGKEFVEGAWNLMPDYGEIARIAREEGEDGLKKVKLKIGIPFVPLLAEKSPDLKSAMETFENPTLEYKYDGMRTEIHKKGDRIWLYSRRLENVTNAFPDIVKLAREHIKAENAIVEGESLATDPKTGRPLPFQMLSTRIKRKHGIDKAVQEMPVQVNIFDIAYLDGRTFFDAPLKERVQALRGAIDPVPGKFQLTKQRTTKDMKEADAFYSEALKAGHEGLIVKNLDAMYVSGRRVAGGWLKVKPVMETLDLAITGASWGTGKRAGWMASFILSCRDPGTGRFLECGMMGTGIKEKVTDEGDVTFKEMTDVLKPHIESESGGAVKISPKMVVEVAYEEIQKSPTYSSGWALRFPRFLRIRHDKGLNDCDTIGRVEGLYAMQKGKGQVNK